MTAPDTGDGSEWGTLTEPERRQMMAEVEAILAEISAGSRQRPRMEPERRAALNRRRQEIQRAYFARLPRIVMSRCPVCDTALVRAFDPWGFDGFWWQESQLIDFAEPPACQHFRVLTGAVNLQGLPVIGGAREAHVGPEVPYVIPAVLDEPTMHAVIAELPMRPGYRAYPIAYFSEAPPSRLMLAHPWTRSSASAWMPNGRLGWSVLTDPWDFDLEPWAQRGKLRWIEPGDSAGKLSTSGAKQFPYAGIAGARERQVIEDSRRFLRGVPHGEEVDPFSG